MPTRYRVLCSFRNNSTVHQCASITEALSVGMVFAQTWVDANNRVGSLRGSGRIDLWDDGAKAGSVVIEEYCHGQYVQIGG